MNVTMIYVLLGYGAAFVATGFALGLQALAAETGQPLPRSALWLASSFAVVHGAAEWARVVPLAGERAHGEIALSRDLSVLVLLAVSFALLMSFGLRLWAPERRRRIAIVPAAALAAWAALVVVALRAPGRGPWTPEVSHSLEAATRYFLGLPSCIVAAAGLYAAERRLEHELWRVSRHLAAAAAVFIAYGLLTGFIVPPAPFPPASVINDETFKRAVAVPVEIVRAACAVAVGLLLSKALVLETTRRLQRQVEHPRAEFITLVAHDLRTPLHTIEMGASILERLAPTEQALRVVRSMSASGRTMQKMVSDLLEVSQMDSERLAVHPEVFEVEPLLRRITEWTPPDACHGHAIRLAVPERLPAITADPVRVEQVLSNLLSNAGKYAAPGTEILVEAQPGPAEITISVTNAGEGIAPGELTRIFARHYRTRHAERHRVRGLGLGLYISKRLVEAQGGRIWVESERGRYATFRFTLPRVLVADERLGGERAPRRAP